jgi:uncharacterized protein YndB with AHSA1/START domain/uncharacterized glyoxalase superfamily protein PhnB
MQRQANSDVRELIITRSFDAKSESVWKAWTEPGQVKRWWGPKVFTAPHIMIDLRVGGGYLYCMRSPEGKDYWSKGIYKEIIIPERLVLTDSFADEKGNTVPASYYGLSPDFPLEALVTITFAEDGGKTKLTLRYLGIPADDFDNAKTGWNESLDKLADFLAGVNRTVIIAEPGKREFIIMREFNAPSELVFKAFTDPGLYVQWLGPRRFKMTLEQFEPRNGGSWRYTDEDKDGNKFGFHGVYHEISPSLLIDTFEFEGGPEKGHVSLETARLEELPGGRTRLKIQSVFQSVADRDAMIQGGMEAGVRESHERLDELLQRMMIEGKTKMLKLSPYIRFNGNCREAMEFYKECLGGTLTLMTVKESPMAVQMPEESRNKVMHAMLETNGMVILASDMFGLGDYLIGNNVSISITGTGEEEMRKYFAKLSVDASAVHPIENTFFGVYGDFTDKFGIRWMFQSEKAKK